MAENISYNNSTITGQNRIHISVINFSRPTITALSGRRTRARTCSGLLSRQGIEEGWWLNGVVPIVIIK